MRRYKQAVENLRTLLQQEFIKRNASNSSYSLRAYAKHLGIYHATLSALISGKRKITHKTAKKLSAKLGLDPLQLRELSDFSAENSLSYFTIKQDVFNSIAEWHFDAILELTKIKKLKLTPQTISQAIGISVVEARVALETLLRIELIKRIMPHS
jgi:plasmid maintenance system antidote protein VapI